MKQREIKFRAWHKTAKSMSPGQTFNQWLTAVRDGQPILDEGLLMMQYTGLKDKNGKEIYEGDIINTAPWMPTEEYGSDYFEVVKYEIYNENEYPTTVGFRPFTNFENSPTASKCEVIGNIYENPELLNGN